MPKHIVSLSIVLLIALAYPQGSASGYGQQGGMGVGGFGGGGFGGAGGGGFGGRAGSSMNKNVPSDTNRNRAEFDDYEAIWDTKSAILTPGDRVEFKLSMKSGETVMAGVSSDAFDPALSIEDSKGKVLNKNDDREEGDQEPFLIFTAPKEGEYKLKVLSYRSVSGGKFTIKMRRFVPILSGLGNQLHDSIPVIKIEASPRLIFRLPVDKDKVVDLRSLQSINRNVIQTFAVMKIVGPTGVKARDYETIPTPDGTTVFKALAKGDYFIEYQVSEPVTQLRSDFTEVEVIQIKLDDEQTFTFKPGEFKLISFPVEEMQIVRTTVSLEPIATVFTSPEPQDNRYVNGGDESSGNSPAFTWYRYNTDSDRDILRVFHAKGMTQTSARNQFNREIKWTIKNTTKIPVWESGKRVNDSIEIGDTRLFVLNSKKSELMRVAVSANHFQPRLDIIQLDGAMVNTLMNRHTHSASDDLYFPEAKPYIVRISCSGNGGSGDFTMSRDIIQPTPYTLDTAGKLAFDGKNFGLYGVNLEAGKRYELLLNVPVRVDLLDEDGQFLVSQGMNFGSVTTQYFIPTKSGLHRLWLRNGYGEVKFKLRLHTPPTIDGG